MQPSPFILASTSPRRRQLLQQLGLPFDILPAHVDETIDVELPPDEHVRILAERKARDVAFRVASGVIVGADTIVVIDGDILEKPVDHNDAVRMLSTLSGRRHDVYTGIALLDVPSWRLEVFHERTEVWFRELEMQEILDYVRSGSPMDKAGSYGIQDDFGAVFVERVHGCYYNVVGLPLSRFYTAFRRFTRPQPVDDEE